MGEDANALVGFLLVTSGAGFRVGIGVRVGTGGRLRDERHDDIIFWVPMKCSSWEIREAMTLG